MSESEILYDAVVSMLRDPRVDIIGDEVTERGEQTVGKLGDILLTRFECQTMDYGQVTMQVGNVRFSAVVGPDAYLIQNRMVRQVNGSV